ncbi:MAG TPA: hypothetical protein VGP47_00870 [Parachlamydiaceae bacterium]|nr:hypothetical protein [Parachlamydiaceae bacterium]
MVSPVTSTPVSSTLSNEPILNPHTVIPPTVNLPTVIPATHELLKSHSVSIVHIFTIAQSALKNTKNFSIHLFNSLQDRVFKTPLSPIIGKINSVCTDVEKILNIAGSTPWMGFLFGTLQSVLGQAEAVAGISLMIISELSLIFAEISRVDLNLGIKIEPKAVNKWQILSKFGMELTIHGCLNAIRGTGVALICSYTFGLGNVVLLFPNLSRGRNFSPYFEYGTITDQLVMEDRVVKTETAEADPDLIDFSSPKE